MTQPQSARSASDRARTTTRSRRASATAPSPTYPWGSELPLVGRRAQVETLRLALDSALDGRGSTHFVIGESGIGKTRLTRELAADAEARNFAVTVGSAFAVEARSPYGVLANAFVPLLNAMDPALLSVLTRGLESDLQAVLPGLRTAASAERAIDADARARLHWNFVQFVKRLTARRPLLLIFDNAQWCDPSSLEMAHFLARQIGDSALLFIITHASDEPNATAQLSSIQRSLLMLRHAAVHNVEPLTIHDVSVLLQQVFRLKRDRAETDAATLHRHTGGNAFFLEETLKVLLQTGGIRRTEDGWTTNNLTELTLPRTVRDTVAARLATLSDAGRRLAEIAAVVGARASLELLQAVSQLEATAFADAIDELCARRILLEHNIDDAAHYEFAHPIVQSAVFETLTTPRTRALHASIADALLRLHGDTALQHATEIALHMTRGSSLGARQQGLAFLVRAGRDALVRRADREAAQWLTEALEIADRREPAPSARELRELLEDLATARRRLGENTSELLARADQLAQGEGDGAAQARIQRLMGITAVTRGEPSAALKHFQHAENIALAARRQDLAIRARLSAASSLQALGRAPEAIQALSDILPTAERLADAALLGRVHRVLLQLYGLSGQAQHARRHGEQALAYAAASGDKSVAWSAHWAMAILAGFTGDSSGVTTHRAQAAILADELRSPVLQICTAEIAIEYASAVGDWSEGLALAERTIPIARAVASRTLLPRLLVWTGIMVLARDDFDRARALFDEAWQLSRAHELDDPHSLRVTDLGNVHNVILAHTGQASLQLAIGAWRETVDLCDRAVALADRFGLVVWAIHRLLPILAEALLWLQDYDRVEAVVRRLREQSGALGHRLGLGWAAAIEALVMRFKHQSPDAAAKMIASAYELDAVPFVFHAARLRRNAAQLLVADGDTETAIRELRIAHDIFARLGSEWELRGTRSQLRSLGVRLPPRHATSGAGALSGRELEIARCVAQRLSNKEIAQRLDISTRTVSTHLSNIFEKLSVQSRGELADVVRSKGL